MTLEANATATPVTLLSAIQWEPFGAVKSWQWGLAGGANQPHERSRDEWGRIVRYRLGNTIRDLTYDAGDRIVAYTHYDAVSAASVPSLNQSFGYDELARLTSIATASATWGIGYDANGNRTNLTLNGLTGVYTTPSTSNRLTGTTNPTRGFGYDNAGNTLTTTTTSPTTATYNAENRLATMRVGTVTTTYAYDALGQRTRKYSTSGAASTVIFVYDPQGRLLGEYNSAGSAIRELVWLDGEPVAAFTPNGTNPPNVFYVHNDHIQTPRVVTNPSGVLRWTWMAEPFGTTAANTNPAGQGAFTFNLRHPGQYADQESGLFYNYFRDYDATIGRYVQSDPIGLAGGINTYLYANASPLTYTDPNGLDPWYREPRDPRPYRPRERWELPEGAPDDGLTNCQRCANLTRLDCQVVGACIFAYTYYEYGAVAGLAAGVVLVMA